MKKTFTQATFALCGLVLTGLMAVSCHNDEATSNDNNRSLSARPGSCTADCISDGIYFEQSDSKTVVYGSNSKTVDIQYYNTETDFVLKVRSTNGWSDLVIDEVSSWTAGPVAANTWQTYTMPLADGWRACDNVSFALQVAGNGPPARFDVNYSLIGVCPPCVTDFTGEVISCGSMREAVYTFSSTDAITGLQIQGGLTNFSADATVSVSGGSLTVTQSTPGSSSNRIISLKGSVGACETVTIRVTWPSTNSDSEITGSWSAKNEMGDLVAPVVAPLMCE
jgi:hypothetical protein